jgi:hypothetical protein
MWQDFHSKFSKFFSGEEAFRQACEQNRIERYFSSNNFEKSAERCGDELHKAGLNDVEVENFPADGKTAWYGWKSRIAWDAEFARLWIVSPHKELMCDWTKVPQSLVMYSGSCNEEGELVEWNGEKKIDLKGKIPFTHLRINDVYPQMRILGIKGILSDFIGILPGVRDAHDLPNDVRWENSALGSANGKCWGFMFSANQGQMIRSLMKKGPVRIKAEIKSKIYKGIFKSATGVIKGSEEPQKEILFVSHLYEPGANDNASGTGVGLELARSLNAARTRSLCLDAQT